ncbi:MAG TPA: hypothetical protein DCW90_14760 [Lachnospiraceae bacterium]|nr:hypothetical protein [Lachnospiraceae bacterium]
MDSDGYALSAQTLRATIMELFEKEIRPILLKVYEDDRKMLDASEGRIDRTNEIVDKLTEVCKSVETKYTAHLSSLQKSRDTSQQANAELVSTCNMLSARLKEMDTEHKKTIEGKDKVIAGLMQDVRESREQYRELQKSYLRIAEAGSLKQTGNVMEMNVKQ